MHLVKVYVCKLQRKNYILIFIEDMIFLKPQKHTIHHLLINLEPEDMLRTSEWTSDHSL